MFAGQAAEVSLGRPIRALAPLRADKAESRFLAGASSATETSISLLRYQSELNQLVCDGCLQLPSSEMVQKLACSATNPSLFLALCSRSSSATLYKIPDSVMENQGTYSSDIQDMAYSEEPLEEKALLLPSKAEDGAKLVDFVWRGTQEEPSAMGDVLTLDERGLVTQWDLSLGSTAEEARSLQIAISDTRWNLPPRLAWDPHRPDAVALAMGTTVKMVDLRIDEDQGITSSFHAHRYGITSLDYNPNKPGILATSGKDGLVKFWDVRSSNTPLIVARGGHSHWVTKVKYNPFHDQLILSAGTDSVVNLWRVSSISSAPILTLESGVTDEPLSETAAPNVRIDVNEHMDSVYDVAWSAADAWVYASASYDGKVALHTVPSKEKYKILL